MNRSQLFSESWSFMRRNRALWIIGLIGAAISLLTELIFITPDIPSTILTTLVQLLRTAFTTGALISMVNLLAEGQTATLNDGVEAGLQRIFPLTFVQLTLLLPIWIIAIVITGSILAAFNGVFAQPNGVQATNVVGVIGSTLGVAVLILLASLVTSAIGVGADRAVVLENQPVFAALRRGWSLLTTHLSDFVMINLFAIAIGIAISFAYACTLGPIFTSIVLSQNPAGPLDSTALATSPVYPLILIVGALIGVFLEVLLASVWTLAFRQWQGK